MPTINDHITNRDLECLEEARREGAAARAEGNHPFGAVLADTEGRILLRARNTVESDNNDCGHAETNLAVMASKAYSREFLRSCTLYTSVEPCAMCAGAVYWSDIRRVVYGISEHRLLEMTGDDPENQTFNLPCREVFDRGQKDIIVAGPAEDPDLVERIADDHRGFWNPG